MAGYTINSAAGKDIASKLSAGSTYKATDGSTWKKNSDGTVSVTTKNGGYTKNAFSTVSSAGSSKSTNGSTSTGAKTYLSIDDFYNDNAARINGLAMANNVDKATAKNMLISNITGSGNYQGAGAANMGELLRAYQSALAADSLSKNNSYYDKTQDLLSEQYNAQRQALQQQIASTVGGINAQKDTAQKTYEQQLREAYIANEKNKLGLNDYLSANGYTGGMAESTLESINNQYTSNRFNANEALNNAFVGYDQLINEAKVSGNSNLVDIAGAYTNNLVSAFEKKQAYDYQSKQDAQNQTNYENENAANIWAMYVDGAISYETAKKALAGTVYSSYLPTSDNSIVKISNGMAKSSGTNNGRDTVNVTANSTSESLPTTAQNRYANNIETAIAHQLSNEKISSSEVVRMIKNALNTGNITTSQAKMLLSRFGY